MHDSHLCAERYECLATLLLNVNIINQLSCVPIAKRHFADELHLSVQTDID